MSSIFRSLQLKPERPDKLKNVFPVSSWAPVGCGSLRCPTLTSQFAYATNTNSVVLIHLVFGDGELIILTVCHHPVLDYMARLNWSHILSAVCDRCAQYLFITHAGAIFISLKVDETVPRRKTPIFFYTTLGVCTVISTPTRADDNICTTRIHFAKTGRKSSLLPIMNVAKFLCF